MFRGRAIRAALIAAALLAAVPFPAHAEWFRGNTHTHTRNSDGDASPAFVARWYRDRGYQFVVITDHELLTDVAPLQARFGADGKFLVLPGQELTQIVRDSSHPEGVRHAHVNAINAERLIPSIGRSAGMGRLAPEGTSLAETFARNIAEIRAAGGIAQVNHPNYDWSVGLEDLLQAQLPDGTLLEIWSGLKEAHNLGGTNHAGEPAPSAEALWDALLTRGRRLWAVGSDDSHFFYDRSRRANATPGQAWIVVRAERLTAEDLTAALQEGRFYASTGITLDDYVAGADHVAITIRPGSRRARATGDDPRVLTRFIGSGGRVLSEVRGLAPHYTIRGDEGYVRAAITDAAGRRAWTQPVFLEP